MMQRSVTRTARCAWARGARVLSTGSSPQPPTPPSSSTAAAGSTDKAAPSEAEEDLSKPVTAADLLPPAEKPKKSTPMQNLKDVMDTLDIMIEEAEKKTVKKYRPNMFAEFKQLNDTNGKVFVGPETLTDVSHAASVPSLKVSGLDGTEADLQELMTAGKVTLLLTSFKNFGMNMLPAWREPFQQQFAGNSRVQTLTVNIIEDWYMKLVAGSITRGLQKQTAPEELPFTFAHFGRCDDFRTPLDLNNSFVGYAHLVDGKGRIRWMAGGQATPEELERLMNGTKQLLDQQKQTRRR